MTCTYMTIDTARLAMAFGLGAGSGTAASNYNHIFGNYAGGALTTGFNNCGFGLQVLADATTAQACTGMGLQALQHITTAQQATAFGIHALLSNTTGFGNVAVGAGSMQAGTVFEYNTAIGTYAGRDNQGNRNVFVGNRAGMTHTTGDDRLYIANNEIEELIGGDFATREAWVNGDFKAEAFALDALNTAPASASAVGIPGSIRIDADYIYVCTDVNTWKRTALASW